MKKLNLISCSLLLMLLANGCYHPDYVECTATLNYNGSQAQGVGDDYYTRKAQYNSITSGCKAICQDNSICQDLCWDQADVQELACYNKEYEEQK